MTPRVSGGPSQTAGGRTTVTSGNWAGYAATGANGTFTSVSSSWTEPTGRCSGGAQYAAFWIGLDGYTSNTVEQAGSEVDCAGRIPRYYAWYAMYPGAAVNFPNPVSPGDHFSGSVTYQGSNHFQLVLQDTTEGWTRTVNATLAGAALSSAEVIAEAPCCTAHGGVLPLADFGTVSFSPATANGQSMATFSPDEIVMPKTSVSAMGGAGNFSMRTTGSPASPGYPAAAQPGTVTERAPVSLSVTAVPTNPPGRSHPGSPSHGRSTAGLP